MIGATLIHRPVPGYADLYAGIDGSIVHAQHGQLVAKTKGPGGYLYVYIPGVGTRFVHVLVAAAYLGERPPGLETRHADSRKFNSAAGNLCYGTHADNAKDAIAFGAHGAYTNATKTHCPQGHEYDSNNTYTAPDGARQCRTCRANQVVATEASARRVAQTNGQGLTREQKASRVDQLLREFPTILSDRAIARRAGVSHTTVRRRRASLLGKG